MDDLVEKLRRRAKQNRTPGGLLVMVDPGTLNEAADELARLRALVAPDTPDGATPPDVIERAADVIDIWYDQSEGCIWRRPEEVASDLLAANLLAASSPAVTAAERDVFEAAVAWVKADTTTSTYLDRCNATFELRMTVRALHAAVDRLAAARNDTGQADR